jgi:hypothetical protein
MSTTKKASGGNLLLWVGLAMMVSALLLALLGSFYAARVGGMMGQGYGAPGWGAAGGVGSLPEAREAVEQSLQSYGNPNLEVTEVMEFANNYYAEVREKDTGIGAMELLVDKDSGQVYPEPGPNMMWNTKYGMMSGGRGMGGMMGPGRQGMMSGQPFQRNPGSTTGTEMTITPERAREIANDYLGRISPGTEADEAERFYGYYTLHTKKGDEITGMLSVNGYSGEVWYHSWHGPFIAMEEED